MFGRDRRRGRQGLSRGGGHPLFCSRAEPGRGALLGRRLCTASWHGVVEQRFGPQGPRATGAHKAGLGVRCPSALLPNKQVDPRRLQGSVRWGRSSFPAGDNGVCLPLRSCARPSSQFWGAAPGAAHGRGALPQDWCPCGGLQHGHEQADAAHSLHVSWTLCPPPGK